MYQMDVENQNNLMVALEENSESPNVYSKFHRNDAKVDVVRLDVSMCTKVVDRQSDVAIHGAMVDGGKLLSLLWWNEIKLGILIEVVMMVSIIMMTLTSSLTMIIYLDADNDIAK